MKIRSKFPAQETTIFSVMSALANEYGAINLSQGFPNFEPDAELIALVHDAMKKGFNQYAPMPGHKGLRDILASKHQRSSGQSWDQDKEITVTAGATQAIFTAISSIVRPREEVMYFEPAYDCYRPAIELTGATPVPIALHSPEFTIDWNEVAQKITPQLRMIIVNTPSNPGCYTWSANDWDHLENLVAGKDIVILSDEVYEHLVYDPEGHISVLSREKLKDQCMAAFSFGKNFHMTGWKLGYLVASAALTEEFRKLHQYIVFSVHHPSQQGIAKYLEEPLHYEALAGFYREKYERFLHACSSSRFRFLPSAGSYFVLADYSDISDLDDRAFAEWLTREAGVACIPLSPFYSDPPTDQRLVRFCFAKTDDLLDKAGKLLSAV